MIFIIVTVMFMACTGDKKDTIDYEYDPNVMPMVGTDSVTMLISDSGVIRYKILAQTWDIYESSSDPYWLFPDKFYGEQFDTLFQVIATVDADSVWYYTRQKLALLKGNVFIRNNVNNETFSSDELFWDQDKRRIYSNKLVEIVRPGKMTLIATQFESNEQMTNYSFVNAKAPEIYVNQENRNEEQEEKIKEKEE